MKSDEQSKHEQEPQDTPQNSIDPSLPLLIHLLLKEPQPSRLMLAMGGLLIEGRAVNAETWLQAQKAQDASAGKMLEKSISVHQPGESPSPRVIYLRERLRWGSGLTEEQMQELEEADRSEPSDHQHAFLIDVKIHTAGGILSHPAWRVRLDRIDGYGLTKAPMGET